MEKWIGISRRVWGFILMVLPTAFGFMVETGWMTADPQSLVAALDGVVGHVLGLAGGAVLVWSILKPDNAALAWLPRPFLKLKG